MSVPKHEEVGFVLENGMKISLCRPGVAGVTNMGEHLDLVVQHPDGGMAIMVVTCFAPTAGDKYVEIQARHGQPLKQGGHIFQSQGPSFQPSNLLSVSVGKHSIVECTVGGVFSKLKLNLTE